MKHLWLLRHAESSRDNPWLADHDRPLAPRGERDAARIGRHLRETDIRPDLILCSTARRTEQTLALLLEQFERPNFPVEKDASLYLPGWRVLAERLQRLPDEVGSVLLVAHNPDLQELILKLAGPEDAGLRKAIAKEFPPAALAAVTLPAASWAAMTPETGRLDSFVRPGDLD